MTDFYHSKIYALTISFPSYIRAAIYSKKFVAFANRSAHVAEMGSRWWVPDKPFVWFRLHHLG